MGPKDHTNMSHKDLTLDKKDLRNHGLIHMLLSSLEALVTGCRTLGTCYVDGASGIGLREETGPRTKPSLRNYLQAHTISGYPSLRF